MSDTTKRDAVLEEFCPQRYRESPWQTIRKLAAEDMADEILRLRAAVERVRALHPDDDQSFCYRCRVVSPCRTIRALEGTP
jgi:hypothetical protein